MNAQERFGSFPPAALDLDEARAERTGSHPEVVRFDRRVEETVRRTGAEQRQLVRDYLRGIGRRGGMSDEAIGAFLSARGLIDDAPVGEAPRRIGPAGSPPMESGSPTDASKCV